MKTTLISDELLARFLDHKTTEEETELVLSYLNEEKDHLEEFLSIRKASLLAGKTASQTIDIKDSAAFIKNNTHSSKKSTNNKRVALWISVAASIIVIISVSYFIVYHKPHSNPMELAQTTSQDSLKLKNEEEISNSVPIKNEDPIINTDKKQPIDPDLNKSESDNGIPVQIKTQHNATSQSVENSLSIIKPAKSPYTILCKNMEKELFFQWQNTTAKSVTFRLFNSKNEVIITKSDPTMRSFALLFKELKKEKKIFWEVKVVFEDGTSDMKTGRIEITYAE